MDLLGLTPPQTAVYRAVLRRPGSCTGRLAQLVGLPEEQVEEALHTLRARGFVRGLVPVRPDTVLEPALVEVEQDLTEARAGLVDARQQLTELVELYAGGVASSDSNVEVERIDSGRVAVQRRVDELSRSVTREMLAVNPASTRTDLDDKELSAAVVLTGRGAQLRTIVGAGVYDDPADLRHAHDMQAVGDQHRVHPDPPLQMLLLDRRVAVVPIDPEASADGALFIWSPPVVRSFLLLYESLWEQSRPLLQPVDAPPELPPREARLLELLAAGLKDEAIARHLGISVRTVRRESAALLDRLGAATRFQAGIEAARRGWL